MKISNSYRKDHRTVLIQVFRLFPGRPQPEVSWFLEGKLIDNTYQIKSSSLVVNQLNDLKLSREHLNAQLTCVANNTALANPISRLVLLNINRKYKYE